MRETVREKVNAEFGTKVDPKWSDGSIDFEMELNVRVNWQEKGKLYYQVFHQGDTKGRCDLSEFLTTDERAWIEAILEDEVREAEDE